MSRVVLRPARAEDFAALVPDPLPWRIKAVAAEVDGKVVGIGGLVYRPDGVWASVVIADEGRRYKVALYRAAKQVLADARKSKIRKVFAVAEAGRHGAEAFLLRLGFEPVEGSDVFVWRA
jgi:N-acetylglutamate synthase-like GNAT family acetyltransferase